MTAQSKAQIKSEIAASSANNLLGGSILNNIVDSYYDSTTIGTISTDVLFNAPSGTPVIISATGSNPALTTTGSIGVGAPTPGNQVATAVAPVAGSCVDVQYPPGPSPTFSLVINGSQGTFYAVGYNAGYAWFQTIGPGSVGPAYAMALNNDTTLGIRYSNNSFTSPTNPITTDIVVFTPSTKSRFSTSGEFAQTNSNITLASYYQGPYVFVQCSDPNFTNGNTCAYDFRDGHGHSFAAIVGQVLAQSPTVNTGVLAFGVSNNASAATIRMLFFASGGLTLGTAGSADPGAGSLFASGAAGIGTNAISTAVLALTAATTAKSQINLASSSGTAPTSPNDGDLWYDGTNVKFRLGGTTKSFTLA